MPARRSVCFFALLALATVPSLEAPVRRCKPRQLTLSQALDLAKRNSPTYRQTLNNADPAAAQVRQAKYALFPTFDVGSGLGYTGAGSSTFGGTTFNQSSPTLSSNYSLNAALQISAPIFVGPRIAKAQERAATGKHQCGRGFPHLGRHYTIPHRAACGGHGGRGPRAGGTRLRLPGAGHRAIHSAGSGTAGCAPGPDDQGQRRRCAAAGTPGGIGREDGASATHGTSGACRHRLAAADGAVSARGAGIRSGDAAYGGASGEPDHPVAHRTGRCRGRNAQGGTSGVLPHFHDQHRLECIHPAVHERERAGLQCVRECRGRVAQNCQFQNGIVSRPRDAVSRRAHS